MAEGGGLLGLRPRAILRRDVTFGKGGLLERVRARVDEFREKRPRLENR